MLYPECFGPLDSKKCRAVPVGARSVDEFVRMSGKKRNARSTNTSVYTGVSKRGKRFVAQIYIGGKMKHLGTFDTTKEAALAYDRAVIQHKLSSSRLNFPNDYTTSSEDDGNSEEESGDSSSSNSDDEESDDKATPPTTIKEEPEAELILHKTEEVHVKSEPEAEF